MPKVITQTLSIPNPIDGMNTKNAAITLPKEQGTLAEDLYPWNGAMLTRPGYAAYGGYATGSAFSSQVMEFKQFYNVDSLADHILAICQDNVYYYDPGNGGGRWTVLNKGDTWSGDVDDLVFSETCTNSRDDLFIFTNGKNKIQRWTGQRSASYINLLDSEHSSGECPYTAKFLGEYKHHLMLFDTIDVASGGAAINRIRWSYPGNCERFPIENYVDLVRGGRATVAAARLFGGSYVIYKEASIWLCQWIGGASQFRFDILVEGVGLAAPRSLVNTEIGHIFLGWDNVYLNDGKAKPTPIGDPIKDDLMALAPAYKELGIGYNYATLGLYLLFVPPTGQTTLTTCWAYNYKTATNLPQEGIKLGTWWKWTFPSAISAIGECYPQGNLLTYTQARAAGTTYTVAKAAGTRYRDYGAHTADTKVLTAFAGTTAQELATSQTQDASTDILPIWISKDFYLTEDHPSRFAIIQHIDVETKGISGTKLKAYYSVDQGASYVVLADTTNSTTWNTIRYPLNITTQYIRIKLTCETSSGDASMDVRSISIDYIPVEGR